MSAYTTFASLEDGFTAPLENFISSGSSNLASAVAGPLTLAVTLYVIITGILMMLGKIDTPIREIALRVIKLGIIIALVKESGTYQQFVTGIFFETLPNEITSALSSGSPMTGSSLDGLMSQVQQTATDIMKQAGWDFTIVTYGMAGLALIVIALISMAVSFVVTLYAKIALSLVLALGPVFIACALFDSTRRMTEAWFAQVINYVVLQVLVVALGSLLIDILDSQVAQATSLGDALMIPISLGATFVAAGYILYQLPQLAASLAGGGMSLAYGTLARNDARGSTVAQSARYLAGKMRGGSKGT
ncbi:type IV secretion system protein [Ancylobacter vacuolatus]|uniref:type IV secretion system protein n=1 Tax=Ancylobacter vacuolatus TaxID=223389 RepID=UPI00362F2983